MLSYQHAYHAGGPADLHKHLMLVELLDGLAKTHRGITYMETHAGRGLYDLASPEAKKTGEAAEGIALLGQMTGRIADLLGAVREAFGANAYPGSPLIASMILRKQDLLILSELHPAEFAALESLFRDTPVVTERCDGFAKALAQPASGPGLVLVDPSYELKDDYLGAAQFANALHARWPEATIMIWYPILRAGRHEELITALGDDVVIDEVSFKLKGGAGMLGSGLAILNAPPGIKKMSSSVIETASPILTPRKLDQS